GERVQLGDAGHGLAHADNLKGQRLNAVSRDVGKRRYVAQHARQITYLVAQPARLLGTVHHLLSELHQIRKQLGGERDPEAVGRYLQAGEVVIEFLGLPCSLWRDHAAQTLKFVPHLPQAVGTTVQQGDELGTGTAQKGHRGSGLVGPVWQGIEAIRQVGKNVFDVAKGAVRALELHSERPEDVKLLLRALRRHVLRLGKLRQRALKLPERHPGKIRRIRQFRERLGADADFLGGLGKLIHAVDGILHAHRNRGRRRNGRRRCHLKGSVNDLAHLLKAALYRLGATVGLTLGLAHALDEA